jgi:hypothetical protein
MRFPKTPVSALAFVLSFALVEVTFSVNAHAGMISTSQAVADLSRARNLEKVQSFLRRADVQTELVKRGVSPREAEMRVASLSDFELQKVAGNVDSAPAGADVVVISLSTLLLVIIILLLIGR